MQKQIQLILEEWSALDINKAANIHTLDIALILIHICLRIPRTIKKKKGWRLIMIICSNIKINNNLNRKNKTLIIMYLIVKDKLFLDDYPLNVHISIMLRTSLNLLNESKNCTLYKISQNLMPLLTFVFSKIWMDVFLFAKPK